MSKKKEKKKAKKIRLKIAKVMSGEQGIFDFLPGDIKAKASLIFPKAGKAPNVGDNVQFEIGLMSIPMAVDMSTGKALGIKSTDFMLYLDSGQAVLEQKLEEPVTFTCTNPTCKSDHTYDSVITFREINLSLGVKYTHLIVKERDSLDIMREEAMKNMSEEQNKKAEESPVVTAEENTSEEVK